MQASPVHGLAQARGEEESVMPAPSEDGGGWEAGAGEEGLRDVSVEVGVGGLRGTSVEKVGEGGLRGGWGEEGCASASTAFSPGWASSLATASDDASRKVGALPGRGPRGLLPGALMPAAQGECRAFAALLGRERCGVHDSAPLGDCSGMMLARALR